MSSDSLFTVRWIPPIEGFFNFVKEYRKIAGFPLGGSRKSKHKYPDPTVSKVLSVGPDDTPSSLPQRVSLSNFDIGLPITSYGCIYRHKGETEPEYLLIRRCDSVSYIDLIRGNYRESQLFFMIGDLPDLERKRLLEYDFDALWYDLHLRSAEGDCYEFGKEAFERIQPHLGKFFNLIPPNDPEGKYLWLFPKGRPNYLLTPDNKLVPESPLNCALREFTEETNGLSLNEEDILLEDPVVERFLGLNSKNYQTFYFVFGTQGNKPEIKLPDFISTGIREVSTTEVSEIRWVPLSQICNFLRPARQELIYHIEEELMEVSHTQPSWVKSDWKTPTEINELFPESEY